jgi:hypothetical protein
MMPKTKKEAPAPPKAKAKAMALKVPKGPHNHKKKKHVTHFQMAQDLAPEAAQLSSAECLHEKEA